MRQGVKHSIKGDHTYFLTLTVVDWVDIFTRKSQCDIFVDALRYCINEKGLNTFAYCIMTNHVHLIANANEPYNLSDTVRDLKKYTSKAIIKELNEGKESRKEWLLNHFRNKGSQSNRHKFGSEAIMP
jgi:REP element-mobilizing transposase RayT